MASLETPPEGTQRPSPVQSFRWPLVFGLVAVALGVWLILDARGVNLPPIKRFWPMFMVVAGLATLVDYLRSRKPGSAGQTVFWFCLAAFCFSISLGYAGWRNLLDLLPGVPTIVGLAFLGTWIASNRKETSFLVPGLLFVTLGLLGFMARFDFLKRILPSAQEIWAIILLVGGGFVLWQILRKRTPS